MEEKIIIKSEHFNIKKIIIPTVVISIVISACILCGFYLDTRSWYMDEFNDAYASQEQSVEEYNETLEDYKTESYQYIYCDHYGKYTADEFLELHPTVESYVECDRGYWYNNFSDYTKTKNITWIYWDEVLISAIPLSLILIVLFIYWWLASYSLTVSNKRIYGKTAFGKRVDLPVDSISAVATSSLKGISVATASGKIIFKLIKNRDEIHSEISKLIITRQEKLNNTNTEQTIQPTDELKKFKELLDIGAITQEEFDAKKKELLGL